ncbi:Transposon Ty3-I Gag-Pol polyprotein [Labeo rohita]|uniref:ribonuclease H n=1 Tax=Labeo rohita TaxID=84645 RepID=A0ABQ8L5N3_LABRO|nr:Transposon Ty3-I Gag-Pol polyprotein [Labeo rohita]
MQTAGERRARSAMEEVLQRLAEVSIRQHQIVEHLAIRQGRTEDEVAAIRISGAQGVPLPDPRAQATRLLPKMTADDDVEAYLQVFENTATQNYDEVKREILARLGLSPICAAQQFHKWEFKPSVPARAQAAELGRIAQHWLLEGNPTAAQVAEQVVVDRLLRALTRSHRQAVGMRNPTSTLELVEAIELVDAVHQREAGDRAPPFPRRVVQERRPLEGTSRPVSRPPVPSPRDEPMPSLPAPEGTGEDEYDHVGPAAGAAIPYKPPEELAALSLTEPVVVDVNPHLSAAQKTELQHLVRLGDVFSSQPGQTNVVQHDIRTPPGVIVRQRPYRVPEARRQAIEEEVQQMLKLGVIEPSLSPWSSPTVMVPKPDGTLRFCNDFRHLNEVSEFDGYPMPRVDELLDRLGRARYITTLDLTKGYWQWPLAVPDSPLRPPRGPRDVPTDDGYHLAAAYLDDMVVHSEAWEEHLDRLRRVLSELRRAGLTANPRKCHLAFSEAKYLGFQVGRGLIRPQEKKVEAVCNAPRPQTKSQVRAFLGLAGYYRCFIPNFSSLAAPLTDMTRKGQPKKVCWSDQQPTFRLEHVWTPTDWS